MVTSVVSYAKFGSETLSHAPPRDWILWFVGVQIRRSSETWHELPRGTRCFSMQPQVRPVPNQVMYVTCFRPFHNSNRSPLLYYEGPTFVFARRVCNVISYSKQTMTSVFFAANGNYYCSLLRWRRLCTSICRSRYISVVCFTSS
jgi:hypothetical protein